MSGNKPMICELRNCLIISLFSIKNKSYTMRQLKLINVRGYSTSHRINGKSSPIDKGKALSNISKYINIRTKTPNFKFSRKQSQIIHQSFNEIKYPIFNESHSLLFKGKIPTNLFQTKPTGDRFSIRLWNIIMGPKFKISSMEGVKPAGAKFIKVMDERFPDGLGMSEANCMRYITAQSSSSFLGIQNPSKSSFSYNAMIGTLSAHASPTIVDKPWLIDNLKDIHNTLQSNSHFMSREYGDVCLHAKLSSASFPGYSDYREFVFTNTLRQVLDQAHKVLDYVIFPGVRIDRRAKYRLICSFIAHLRIIDFLLHNGSYAICESHGPYANYTTEGLSPVLMWEELAKMSRRGDYKLVCIDYKGYDTQISLMEYYQLSRLINKHRINQPLIREMFNLFSEWIHQPKMLSMRSSNGYEMLMPYYRTLASGLHATHSFQNLIGISTYKQMERENIRVVDFWTNGDDQNTMVHKEDLPKMMKLLNKYFVISWEKSLVGHKLAVWGKLWFAQDIHPAWEIGTFRAIWERETGSSDLVEPSKFLSNYGKILQTMILMMRVDTPVDVIEKWMVDICAQSKPPIDPYRIPVSLTNTSNMKTGSYKNSRPTSGLDSQKSYLKSKTYDLSLWSTTNYYTLLEGMFKNRVTFDQNISEVVYHLKGAVLEIKAGFDYSYNPSSSIPFMFAKLHKPAEISSELRFGQDILRSTKSYEGPCSRSYRFENMMSLAYAVNRRNSKIWFDKLKKNQYIAPDG
jgi:hypothetical protein